MPSNHRANPGGSSRAGRARNPWLRAGSLAVAAAIALAGCGTSGTSKHGDGSASATGSSSGTEATSGTTVPATAPASPGSALKDPGEFAGPLKFTDISKQVNKAISGYTDRTLSFAEGTMTVPLDWASPDNGKTVSITVVRVRSASQHDRIGSLVINPGGPGGSGVNAAVELAASELPQAILDRFDIVGFDPRGVGLSSPINCISDAEKDSELNLPPDPSTPPQWTVEVDAATKVAQSCYSKYGNDLTFYSTAETARDMDALRAKLGDDKLTYLGYSYGTLLGAEYASAYPDRVRALVLDGAVDPTIDPTEQAKAQAAGFELAFNHYAVACEKQKSCPLGADPRGFVENLMKKSDAKPIPSGDSSDHRVVKAGAVLLGVISALYDESQWDQLTTALKDASNGNGSGILALDDQYNQRQPDGSYSNIEDANATISCADDTQRATVAQAKQLSPQWNASIPLFGGSEASSLGFCSLWKAPPDKPITVKDSNAPTVLVIGTTGDPATPISGARHLASLLGTAKLLVWQGDGHTAYPKTACVTNTVNAYLIDLKAPAAETTCPAS